MDKTEVIEKVKKYADLIRSQIKVQQIILFGSYAWGSPREDSDIDVAVIVDKIDDDFLKLSLKLYRLRRDIDDRIEPLLFEVEKDDSGFLSSVLKKGLVVS